jgi:hypothetical protein
MNKRKTFSEFQTRLNLLITACLATGFTAFQINKIRIGDSTKKTKNVFLDIGATVIMLHRIQDTDKEIFKLILAEHLWDIFERRHFRHSQLTN